jgi:hypothetical protein
MVSGKTSKFTIFATYKVNKNINMLKDKPLLFSKAMSMRINSLLITSSSEKSEA